VNESLKGRGGQGHCHMTHYQFRNHISGMAKATVAKCCMQVECIKC